MVVYIYVVKDLQCNIVHTNMYKYTNFVITIIINYLLTIIKITLTQALHNILTKKLDQMAIIYLYLYLPFIL